MTTRAIVKFTSFWSFVATTIVSVSGATIDTTPPAFSDPPSPWHAPASGSVVTYSFDGTGWTSTQLAYARDAVSQIDEVIPDVTFQESGDFTLRWAGADLFRNWRDAGAYKAPGWDLSGALAIAYKHGNGPWDQGTFPNDEIYFNSTVPWSFGLTSVDPNAYDFWTVALHETIHMIACDSHAAGENEVMFPTIGMGQRKTLQLSDLQVILDGTGLRADPAAIRPGPVPFPDSGATLPLLVVAAFSLLVARRNIVTAPSTTR